MNKLLIGMVIAGILLTIAAIWLLIQGVNAIAGTEMAHKAKAKFERWLDK